MALPEHQVSSRSMDAVSMMTSEIGDFIVGIEAAHIGQVLDVGEISDQEQLVDLASVWGVAGPSSESGRRVLTVATDNGSYQLLLGQTLELRFVPRQDVCPTPALIEEAAAAAGISAFFIVGSGLGDRLGFVIDVDRFGGLG